MLTLKQNPSKVVGVQFSTFSPEEIRKYSVAEITNRNTYAGKKPVLGGLFTPQCGGGDITGGTKQICPTDGLTSTESPGYFAHLELATALFSMQHIKSIIKVRKSTCFACSRILFSKSQHQHMMDMTAHERSDYSYNLCKKIRRCGSQNEDGCGCKQPDKYELKSIASLFAVWENVPILNAEGVKENVKKIVRLYPELVLKQFKRISDDDIFFLGFHPVWARPEWFILTVLPVAPPAVRPSVKPDAQQRSEDDLTHIYSHIVRTNQELRAAIQENKPEHTIENQRLILQFLVASLVNNKIKGATPMTQRSGRPLQSICSRLNTKHGRIRGNLMGKRVNFSARSVITGDPNLSIRLLGVPLKIAKNITKPIIVNDRNRDFLMKLVLNGPDVYPGAKTLERKGLGYTSGGGIQISLRYVDRTTIRLENGDKVHRHLMDGDFVLFNRQPSLHRMSMMAHEVRVMKFGDTFRFNVGDTPPYNADFDGDEMNMHAPQSVQAETELKWLPAIPWQIVSPAKNSPVIGIFQDSLLGSYYFTRPHVNITPLHAMELLMQFTKIDPHALQSFIKKQKSNTTAQARKLKASGKEYTLSSFDILSQICPPMTTTQKNKLHNDDKDKTHNYNNILEIRNGHYVRGQLEKSMFSSTSKGILHRICNDFGNRTCADFIDDLQDIINEYMKTASFSVGISDLISDRQTQMEITKIIEKQKQEVQQLIEKVHLGIFENKTANSNSVHFELEVNNYLNKALEDSGKTARNSLGENNRFVMIVNSGSKGQPQNISQMISCFGQQNVDGKRVPNGYDNRPLPHFCKYDDTPKARGFIENSYITGFTAVEMFYHAMGGRLGLIDTAVKSVTWETPIVIIENEIPKYIEIGKWIDAQLDATPDKVEHHKERNLELMNTTDVYIPTTDEHGVVTWGEVTAITRHDPGSVLYEIKTQGGRSVIVTESKSLLIWNPETKEFHEKLTPEIKVGDGVPVTAELCQPPVTLSHIHLKDYLPKTEYVYGSDFNLAVTMMQNDMKDHHKIAQGWWAKHNGKSFTLPYTKKASLQRTSIRSNIDNIKEGFIYPYGGIRKDTSIPEQFELNEENGIFMGLFLSEGNVYEKNVTITNNNENVRDFVKQWFTKHSIAYKETQRQNKIGGLTTTVVGNSCVLGKFLTKLVGHGAEHKHIPSEAYIAPQPFIIGLLNGYFSGDGTISKNSVEACSASKRLIEDINMLCSRLGIFGKVFKTQLKSNNLNTKKILPSYRISIRAQWAKRFAETVPLLEEKKQQKLQNLKCKNIHRNFETHNHVVVDKIVEINLVDVKDHPKVYDLTIPSTLNFGLANGLQVRDTATTGYIQRRWVKAMEDLVVRYDMTVRNNMNKIIQFKYGDDCVDPVKVEGQYLALLNWNLKEIYDHYDCIGINDQATEEMEIYTKSAQSRLKNQRQEALDKSHQYIENMIETRDILVEKVFRGKDEGSIIKLPVMFKAIIENLQGQLGLGDLVKNKSGKLMSKNSQHKKMEHLEELDEFTTTTDITPLECFQLVENFYETRFKTMGKAIPNRMFELFYYFYLTPKHLLVEKRFHKKALEQLLEIILLRYKQAIVHPGEAVGVIAGQSAGELSTQASLNSFHTAGGKLKKSNMTTGVPRIEELLQLTRSPKTPSLTIYLKPNDELSSDRAEGVSLLIGYMKLSEIVKGVKIMFDPRDDVIPEDNLLIKRYLEFEQQIIDCNQADPLTQPQDTNPAAIEPTENATKKRGKKAAAQKTQAEIEENKSKWVIRLEFDAETMLNKNITMDDVYFVLSRQYSDKISCIYSDYNASNLIFRIRLDNDMFSEAGKKKSGAKSLDRMDDIYILKNFQTQLLNNTVLRGIPGIVNVIPRELRDTVAKEDGKYVKKNTWILDTTGSNLLEVCGLDFIDPYRTYSNNVREVAEVLGMEAAVQVLTMEMSEVLPDINYHHLSLIVDKMCSLKQMCPVCRGGIFADNVGPLMKSSFEMHSEVLLNAARHGEFDNARGVSANVMLGQTGYFGTSAFQVFLDMKKMQSLKEAQAQLSDSRDQLVAKGFEDVLDKDNTCSKSQVSIQNHLDILAVKDSGKVECVDGYDMGF